MTTCMDPWMFQFALWTLLNVIIDMYIIELVIEAGIYLSKDMSNIRPAPTQELKVTKFAKLRCP